MVIDVVEMAIDGIVMCSGAPSPESILESGWFSSGRIVLEMAFDLLSPNCLQNIGRTIILDANEIGLRDTGEEFHAGLVKEGISFLGAESR